MIDIRPNPDEVDASWLTEEVAKRGYTGEVTDFKAKSIGTGQVGENDRFPRCFFALQSCQNASKIDAGKETKIEVKTWRMGFPLTYVLGVILGCL